MLDKYQILVKENSSKKFNVTFDNGTIKQMRLFFHNDSETICYYPKRARKYGYPLRNYINIEVIKVNKDSGIKSARRFLKKVIKTLTESGLWCNILENAIAINNLNDSDLASYLENEYENAAILGVKRFGTDSLACTIKKGFKKINYDYDNCTESNFFKSAIDNNTNYCGAWRKGYDNSLECKMCDDGIKRAWYSEEYKGCGNGHYYLAVSATHAIFCEDD